MKITPLTEDLTFKAANVNEATGITPAPRTLRWIGHNTSLNHLHVTICRPQSSMPCTHRHANINISPEEWPGFARGKQPGPAR
jgi:hypothetical protein